MSFQQPEIWLHGPVENIPALLQPVAHALLQASREIDNALKDFPENKMWEKPSDVASIAFHLQHLTGVLDRLFTYAKAQSLSEKQLQYLNDEGKQKDNITLKELLTTFNKQIEISLKQLTVTNEATLTEHRDVGRKKLPSTVIGLLFHAAEHTMRHSGQMLVTAKFLSANKIL